MGMGYAVAYPFGICGILLTMWLIRMFFRIKIDEEAAQFEQQAGKTKESLQTINIAVRNPNIHGLMLSEIRVSTRQTSFVRASNAARS